MVHPVEDVGMAIPLLGFSPVSVDTLGTFLAVCFLVPSHWYIFLNVPNFVQYNIFDTNQTALVFFFFDLSFKKR